MIINVSVERLTHHIDESISAHLQIKLNTWSLRSTYIYYPPSSLLRCDDLIFLVGKVVESSQHTLEEYRSKDRVVMIRAWVRIRIPYPCGAVDFYSVPYLAVCRHEKRMAVFVVCLLLVLVDRSRQHRKKVREHKELFLFMDIIHPPFLPVPLSRSISLYCRYRHDLSEQASHACLLTRSLLRRGRPGPALSSLILRMGRSVCHVSVGLSPDVYLSICPWLRKLVCLTQPASTMAIHVRLLLSCLVALPYFVERSECTLLQQPPTSHTFSPLENVWMHAWIHEEYWGEIINHTWCHRRFRTTAGRQTVISRYHGGRSKQYSRTQSKWVSTHT